MQLAPPKNLEKSIPNNPKHLLLTICYSNIKAGIGSPRAPGRSLCPAPVSTLQILGPSVGFEVQQGGLQEAIPAIPVIPRYIKMGIVWYCEIREVQQEN